MAFTDISTTTGPSTNQVSDSSSQLALQHAHWVCINPPRNGNGQSNKATIQSDDLSSNSPRIGSDLELNWVLSLVIQQCLTWKYSVVTFVVRIGRVQATSSVSMWLQLSMINSKHGCEKHWCVQTVQTHQTRQTHLIYFIHTIEWFTPVVNTEWTLYANGKMGLFQVVKLHRFMDLDLSDHSWSYWPIYDASQTHRARWTCIQPSSW